MGENEDAEKLLSRIFGEEEVWKEKYTLSWCYHCNTAVIQCPECKNTSCNAGACDACRETFREFLDGSIKLQVEHYLTAEENKVYQKTLSIRRFILETLGQGQKTIDWKKVEAAGWMNQFEKDELFAKELEMGG